MEPRNDVTLGTSPSEVVELMRTFLEAGVGVHE